MECGANNAWILLCKLSQFIEQIASHHSPFISLWSYSYIAIGVSKFVEALHCHNNVVTLF